MKQTKKMAELTAIMLLAAASALNYVIFIFPNRFAPAGLDGLCTMFQDITGINIGYSSLLINVPLLVLACFKLNSDYAVKNIVFILSFSAVSALLGRADLSAIQYYTDNNTSVVLAPVAAGVVRGIIYALTLRLNGASGGIDIIAALVRKKLPHLKLMNIIFALNMCVCVSSYFVYGNNMEPVLCGLLYFYITTHTSSRIRADRNESTKVEIITRNAVDLCRELTEKLHLAATVLDAKGAYSQSASNVVLCIAQKKYIPRIKELAANYPDAVYFISTVNESHTHSYEKD